MSQMKATGYRLQTTVRVFLIAATTVVALAPASFAIAAASVASQPASQPASEIVLVRVGSAAITQEDFNNRTANEDLDKIKRYKSTILKKMIGERMLLLYLEDHPDVLDKSKLDEAIADVVKKEGAKDQKELEAKLKTQGRLPQFKAYLDMKRIIFGRAALIHRGEKRSTDENVLRQVFGKTPQDFDGTRNQVRHILVASNPWDASEQVKAKWDKLARMRQDILAGRRTWEECVAESDDLGTRMIGGDLGFVPRHPEKLEALAKVAFATKQGEISEVFETPVGYHILQVTETHKGELKFEDAKVWIQLYLMQEAVIEADAEAHQQYPVVGVREPDLPPYRPPATRPAVASRPKTGSLIGHRSAATSRPAIPPRYFPATRPTKGNTRGASNISRPPRHPAAK